MNHPFILLIGAILSIGISWNALIIGPQKHFGKLTAQDGYPPALNGEQKQGRAVYVSAGCAKCHTQQVRFFSEDAEYGARFSAANDYLGQDKPLLGTVRIGPDLSNLGNNGNYAGDEGKLNLFKTLFHAKNSPSLKESALAGLMPRHTFLFDQVDVSSPSVVSGPYASLAADLGKSARLPDGQGYVPSAQAEVLAKYLLSLKLDQSIFVSPIADSPKSDAQTSNSASPAQ